MADEFEPGAAGYQPGDDRHEHRHREQRGRDHSGRGGNEPHARSAQFGMAAARVTREARSQDLDRQGDRIDRRLETLQQRQQESTAGLQHAPAGYERERQQPQRSPAGPTQQVHGGDAQHTSEERAAAESSRPGGPQQMGPSNPVRVAHVANHLQHEVGERVNSPGEVGRQMDSESSSATIETQLNKFRGRTGGVPMSKVQAKVESNQGLQGKVAAAHAEHDVATGARPERVGEQGARTTRVAYENRRGGQHRDRDERASTGHQRPTSERAAA